MASAPERGSLADEIIDVLESSHGAKLENRNSAVLAVRQMLTREALLDALEGAAARLDATMSEALLESAAARNRALSGTRESDVEDRHAAAADFQNLAVLAKARASEMRARISTIEGA